jgi:hypothetical protein
MFADDLSLFGETNKGQMETVMETLKTFCDLSGQEISHEKTSIYFAKNVNRGIRDKLFG